MATKRALLPIIHVFICTLMSQNVDHEVGAQHRPQQMTLEVLQRRCSSETERFYRGQVSNDAYCFELLRRAFVDSDERAWESVYAQYSKQIAKWLRSHPLFGSTDEEVGYFVNETFATMAKTCTPDKFRHFPDLPRLLSYMKSCAHTAIASYLRKRGPVTAHVVDEIADEPQGVPVHRLVLEQEWREEFWQVTNSLLQDERERLVAELSFSLGLKPRDIYARHRDLFHDVQDVYRIKENLLKRMRRNPALKQLHEKRP